MKKYFIANSLIVLFFILSNTQSFAGGSGSEGGNGGDVFATEFQSSAKDLLKRLYLADLSHVFGLNLDTLEKIIKSTHVFTVETACLVDQVPCPYDKARDAVNYPSRKHIQLASPRWLNIRKSQETKDALVLHEYFGILGIEQNTQEVSTKILASLNNKEFKKEPITIKIAPNISVNEEENEKFLLDVHNQLRSLCFKRFQKAALPGTDSRLNYQKGDVEYEQILYYLSRGACIAESAGTVYKAYQLDSKDKAYISYVTMDLILASKINQIPANKAFLRMPNPKQIDFYSKKDSQDGYEEYVRYRFYLDGNGVLIGGEEGLLTRHPEMLGLWHSNIYSITWLVPGVPAKQEDVNKIEQNWKTQYAELEQEFEEIFGL